MLSPDYTIQKYHHSDHHAYDISVVIPSWNNLDILKLCIRSIEKHSEKNIQIIVALNEGSDGSPEWVQRMKKVDFVHASQNIGICYAVNACRSLVKAEYLMYANDDMYFLPGWDTALLDEVNRIGHNAFLLSSTMIEPHNSGNPCVCVGNYGTTVEAFEEAHLLRTYNQYIRKDWSGSSWPPVMMHVSYWDLIGGFSIEFSPGMYSDPDISMKMYHAGVRYFKGKGNSLVYHFGSKSTKRIRKKNHGRATFISKWGISAGDFYKHFLKMGEPWNDEFITNMPQKVSLSLIQKLKRAFIFLK